MEEDEFREDPPNKGRPLPPIEYRWKKGVSGNPRGRPKRKDRLTDLLREELKKICPTDPEKRSWGELLVRGLVHLALKGNLPAFKEILDRHDGKGARSDNGRGEKDWDSKSPAERAKLSRGAINAIRDIYGLPHLDPEPEKKKTPDDPEPEKSSE